MMECEIDYPDGRFVEHIISWRKQGAEVSRTVQNYSDIPSSAVVLSISFRDISLVQFETFEDTLICVGLRRIVTVAFLRRVQIFLLTYLLTYLPRVALLF